MAVQEITTLFLILLINIADAQNRWFQNQGFFDRQPAFMRETAPRFQFPQLLRQPMNFQSHRNYGFNPLNGQFMGFNQPMLRQNFRAGLPAGVQAKDTKSANQVNQKKVSLGTDFLAKVDNNKNKVLEAPKQVTVRSEPVNPCSRVVCPRGTLCDVHPSQCAEATCPEYAVCTEIRAVESCEQPVVIGSCSYKYDSYFYNSTSGKCETFIYSGCHGNNNRFSTLKQCEQVCVPSKKFCELAQETGPCRAAKPRWFYHQASKTCQEFIYGGCRGNSNNFDTKAECLKMCSV